MVNHCGPKINFFDQLLLFYKNEFSSFCRFDFRFIGEVSNKKWKRTRLWLRKLALKKRDPEKKGSWNYSKKTQNHRNLQKPLKHFTKPVSQKKISPRKTFLSQTFVPNGIKLFQVINKKNILMNYVDNEEKAKKKIFFNNFSYFFFEQKIVKWKFIIIEGTINGIHFYVLKISDVKKLKLKGKILSPFPRFFSIV
jgi:hypothetical protein